MKLFTFLVMSALLTMAMSCTKRNPPAASAQVEIPTAFRGRWEPRSRVYLRAGPMEVAATSIRWGGKEYPVEVVGDEADGTMVHFFEKPPEEMQTNSMYLKFYINPHPLEPDQMEVSLYDQPNSDFSSWGVFDRAR